MAHTKYLWDPLSDNVLMEKGENGDTKATNTYLPELYGDMISQHRDGETIYYHFDGQGNTRALTDENEDVTDTYTYTAFGEEVSKTGTTENPYRYVGEKGYYFDEETNDYYVRARTYDPAVARWSSQDPLLLVSEDTIRYNYGENNPLFFIDPSGELEQVTVSQGGGRLTCGAYSWWTKWGSGEDAPRGLADDEENGFIVQRVTIRQKVQSCDDCSAVKKISFDCKVNILEGAVLATNYIEFWKVDAWRIFTDVDSLRPRVQAVGRHDHFSFGGLPDTYGCHVKHGEAIFIPSRDIGRRLPRALTGRGVPAAAGRLNSRCITPDIGRLWNGWLKRYGKNSAEKMVESEWACCPDRKDIRELNHQFYQHQGKNLTPSLDSDCARSF